MHVESAPIVPASDRSHDRREPTIMPLPAATPLQRLGTDERRKLQTALDELIACRRLLDAALSETPVS